jgi:3-isopropylmalate dehydrogenase
MQAHIALLPGDGIGPEVTAQARRVLAAVAARHGHAFRFTEARIGGVAIARDDSPLPAATLTLCEQADAVLLGAVGDPRFSDPDAPMRPEQGLLGLRKALGVYANLRPVRGLPALVDLSPLRPERVRGVDLVFVRELTGGIYFGAKERTPQSASDSCAYTVAEIERTVRVAGALARARRGRLTSIDKANVLETSRLWRATTTRIVAAEFPDVRLDHLLVDAAAMHLISRPADFDVLVTENLFGDILTDEASMLVGSLGMLPSASLGDGRRGLYEPVHGSAPDIAGRGIANPYGAILSAAMLLRHSLGLEREARCVEDAVATALERRVLTADLQAGNAATTAQAGDAVLAGIA